MSTRKSPAKSDEPRSAPPFNGQAPQNSFAADPPARPSRLGKAGAGVAGGPDDQGAAPPHWQTRHGQELLLERLARALGLIYRFYNASLINYDDLVHSPARRNPHLWKGPAQRPSALSDRRPSAPQWQWRRRPR